MIQIEAPYIQHTSDRAVVCAPITINGQRQIVWFSTEREYGSYLTDDRLDAFVVGILTTAMRQGEDIICEAPLTRRLHYQLTQYLIPAMASNMDVYHHIHIKAPLTDTPLSCENAVATGWTGGVDSLYTLLKHTDPSSAAYKLSHLLIANVGTLESNHNTELLQKMAENARRGIAAELDLSVVTVDSNLQIIQDENYLSVAAFRLSSAVLSLQKLFSVFLNSAGYEFQRFSFVAENSAYYELFVLSNLETDTTAFYSSGGQVSRMQKLEELSEFPVALKYLHPCIYAARENCGKCGKCVRTMGALYALGKLERFSDVFDVDYFYKNKIEYLSNIISKSNSQHYGEVIAEMKLRGVEMPPEAIRKARIIRCATKTVQKHIRKIETE